MIPDALLTDGVIELRLLRVLEIGDISGRDAASAFLALAPEYRFAIHRRSDGVRVGRIHVRITESVEIAPVLGHTGFELEQEHRRRGYATRAIRLLQAVADHLGQRTLWVLIEPDNTPSRRAVERAGFRLVDEIAYSGPIRPLIPGHFVH
jgi:predicted acetyltransferase